MLVTTTRSLTVAAASAFLVGLMSAGSSEARPRGKASCATAFEQAQEKRRQGKLVEARERLLGCSQRSCGAVVQRECTALLDQVRVEVPSVVLSLSDESGAELTDVSVDMDGAPLAKRLDGRSLNVDPGSHVFSFATRDGKKLERRVTVLEGLTSQRVAGRLPISRDERDATGNKASSAGEETTMAAKRARGGGKARARVRATDASERELAVRASDEDEASGAPVKSKQALATESAAEPDSSSKSESAKPAASSDPASSADAESSAEPDGDAEASAKSRSRRAREVREHTSIAPYVFAGIGVIGIGGFLGLGAMRNAAERDLRTCWPTCSADRIERVRELAIAANVSLGVGGAALATTVVLLLTQKGTRESGASGTRRRASYALDVQSSRGGALATLSGAF